MQYKWTVLTVTTIGVLMAGLDSRIVVIGLPEVIAALHADAEQGVWINQAYLLGSIAVFLVVGRLTDIIGRKNIYTGGFGLFTVGSLLTSCAADPLQIVLCRVVQGIGAGAILTNSVAIIVDATPKKELGFSLGMNNLGFRFGAMAGLTVSGIILSFLGDWRALFYINVPIGLFGTIWAQVAIKEKPANNKSKRDRLDWIGATLFTVFVTMLLLSLTYSAYGIGSELVTVECFAICAFSFVAFVIHERHCDSPLLDFNLFKIREYAGGIIAQLINAISWGAVLLLLSFHFQLVVGLNPFEAGIRIIPFDIAFLATGPISGKLSDKFGHIPFTTSGIALSSVSLFLFSTMESATPYTYAAFYMILFGASMGLFSSPNMSSIMSCVPPNRRGIGSAVRATFFNVGFATSLNLAVLVMSFTVPYALITQIASGYTTISATQIELFSQGLQNTFLFLAGLNSLAIIPSIMRGKGSGRQDLDVELALCGDA